MIRSLFAAFGLLLLSLPAFAQPTKSWKKVFERINAEVLQHSRAYSSLQTATSTIGHRLTGSANGQQAEEFAYNLLQSYGFTDVRYQPFSVESWSRGTLALHVGPAGGAATPIKAVALAHSPVRAEVTGRVVDLGNGLEADYEANPKAAQGHIVLVYLHLLPGSSPDARNLHRSEKTALAIRYGASGIIFINSTGGGILLTGTASVTGKLIEIPAVCIGKEDGLRLKEQLKTGPLVAQVEMTNYSQIIKARNVIATIKGKSRPQEKVVVGGHLDSWDLATGAIDNGIGSFSVLDMARTFRTLKLRPSRTVEFVLFMGEEQGLLGSKAYVEEALLKNSLGQIRFMLNYDMTNDPKGYSATHPSFQVLFQEIGALAQAIDPTFENSFRTWVGLHSDHQPFMLRGIPTGGSAGSKLPANAAPCYHADCDSFGLVDEAGLQNTVRFSSMLLYGLADAAALPAKPLTDEETKAFLLQHNLKEPLQIAGEWRWEE